MEAVHTFEMSVHSNETTWRYIPEDSKLQLFTTLLEGKGVRSAEVGCHHYLKDKSLNIITIYYKSLIHIFVSQVAQSV
jgi:hypothetical protein